MKFNHIIDRVLPLRLCDNSVSRWWDRSRRNSPQRRKDPLRHREQIHRLSILAMLFCLLFFSSLLSFAKEAQPNEDPQIAARMKNLTEQLRCLVCQNETLADSRADLAEDLRQQIREQMKAGKSDKEIIAYLTDRYGKFILYNPPIDPTTYVLWFGPFLFLLAGLAFLFRYLKQR